MITVLQLVVLNQNHGCMFCSMFCMLQGKYCVGRTIDNNNMEKVYCIFMYVTAFYSLFWMINIIKFEFICHSFLECRERKDTKSCILPRLHYAERNFHYLYILRTEYCLSLYMDKIEKCLTRLYQLEDFYKDFIYKYICFFTFPCPVTIRNVIILPCLPIRPQVWLKTSTYKLQACRKVGPKSGGQLPASPLPTCLCSVTVF